MPIDRRSISAATCSPRSWSFASVAASSRKRYWEATDRPISSRDNCDATGPPRTGRAPRRFPSDRGSSASRARRRLGSKATGSPGRLHMTALPSSFYQFFGANSQDQRQRVDHLVHKRRVDVQMSNDRDESSPPPKTAADGLPGRDTTRWTASPQKAGAGDRRQTLYQDPVGTRLCAARPDQVPRLTHITRRAHDDYQYPPKRR